MPETTSIGSGCDHLGDFQENRRGRTHFGWIVMGILKADRAGWPLYVINEPVGRHTFQ